MKKKVLIGGAWPYANNSMHIGHLAALLPGDIIARYHRNIGNDVIYVSGTDSHGTPITIRAKNEGITPSEIAIKYHTEFTKNFNDLNFSYDLYTATTTPYHKEKVGELLKVIYENGYIYEKDEKQDFCETCNEFLSDREIIGTCPYCKGEARGDQCEECLRALETNELLNKRCKTCDNASILKDNKHLYFKLSALQDNIQKLLDSNRNKWRKNAVNETVKYLENGLIDRAITRQLSWGVDVPFPHYEDKKVYVWIEAVMGYLTTLMSVTEDRNLNYLDYLANNKNVLNYYVHGKDNIPFHTVIFPALLQSIDKNYHLPDYIISSEYVNMNDEKMSKSKGNLITVNELLSKFNPDSIRYYMIINNPERRDINFSEDDFIQTHNKFLVGVLGNFINRNVSFIHKKFNGKVKEGTISPDIIKETKKLYKDIGNLIERGELRTSLEAIMNYVAMGNKYYDTMEPWNQVKDDMDEFNNTTCTCMYMIANIANFLDAFIPTKADEIRKIFNNQKDEWKEVELKGDIQLTQAQLLFERIEIEK